MNRVTVKEYCDANLIKDNNIVYLINEALKHGRDINPSKVYSTLEKLIEKADDKVVYNENETMIPEHYTKLKIEPINFILMHNLNFCQGNIVKYLSRLGNKDVVKDELKKVLFYFTVHIEGNYNRLRDK